MPILYTADNLAMAGSPLQWAVAVLLGVTFFAPRLLPPLARLAAKLLASEMERRLGIQPEPIGHPARPRQADADIEILPPARSQPTLRAHDARRLSPEPAGRTGMPLALTAAVVCGAVAVLLWILLHTR